MADPRKVDLFARKDTLEERLKRRRQALEDEDYEAVRQVALEEQEAQEGKKKKKKENGY